jgi:hypothetical protein
LQEFDCTSDSVDNGLTPRGRGSKLADN